MGRLRGIGGYFLRSDDPPALTRWYREHLGLELDENGVWHPEPGPTVFATFDVGSDYFGSPDQQTMLNFRVDDLPELVARLRAAGDDVSDDIQEMEGVGRFAWVTDPEGNRVELWEPA